MKNWDQIRGQSRAQDVFRRAIEGDRLHHGYLMVGPAGVGKRTTALSFVRILNCEERTEGEFTAACGRCPSCRKLDNDLQHPDVRLVVPEGGVNKFIKIDHVRAIQKLAMTKPFEARYHAVVFDDVHAMTDEAANALLKTLEEPPATMRLFLVTDQPQALLDTIRSRCQTVRFQALSSDDVRAVLAESEEAEEATPQDLEVAAAFAEGSPGRARSLMDAGVLSDREEIFDAVRSAARGRPAALLASAEQLARDRRTLPLRLELLLVLMRDVMAVHLGRDETVVNSDRLDTVRELAERYDIEGVLARVDALRTAQTLLSRNVNATMVVENLLTEIAPGPVREPVRIPSHLR